ncbi:integral membrane sensor signal transduction histidine kinase [Vibrio nigripulchritudo ATCC 27043]|uniref:ATP-binding protein n=1 Tax=Vibrio nigripulchritudo TaxID=28173 RepID=UPI00021C4152|nr:ATP-binding protein [Vibrio nigripulchritudo]EGU61277.1 integral membrane sensor signal transduction histidine kinase [Vibrio nigripulchritudo ATCC 27043]
MSLRLKTIFGIALIEAVLLALLVMLTLDYLKSTNYDGLTKRAETTANLFASTVKDAVLSWDLASLEAYTQELMTNPDLLYVRVLGKNGKTLAALGDEELLSNYTKPEMKAELVTDGIFDVAYPIQEAGITYGDVQIGLDMSALNKQIKEAQKWSFFIVMGEMALVALFSYILGAFLTKRLTYLEKAADKIAHGERNIKVNDTGNDEISHLAQAFNFMVAQLGKSEETSRSYQEQLESLNSSLEVTIKSRTAELKANNEHLVRNNRQLKEMQGKLVQSEKMASIGTMAAGFAHEINNPIGTVDSNLQTSLEYLDCYKTLVTLQFTIINEKDEERREQLKTALSQWVEKNDMSFIENDFADTLNDALANAHRVRDIVHGLKSYSLYQKDSPQAEASLDDIVKQCVEQIKYEYQSDIQIQAEISSNARLLCHHAELKQAVNALLKNALQAVQGRSQGTVTVETRINGDNAEVAVSDTGVGIASSQISQVFDPFYSTRKVGDGTGLGLTLAHNIVEQHSGSIEIESQLHQGSTFTIVLPIEAVSADFKETSNMRTNMKNFP